MTDEILAWQTERFQELETSRSAYVVTVRPEQVVEIAHRTWQVFGCGLSIAAAAVLAHLLLQSGWAIFVLAAAAVIGSRCHGRCRLD